MKRLCLLFALFAQAVGAQPITMKSVLRTFNDLSNHVSIGVTGNAEFVTVLAAYNTNNTFGVPVEYVLRPDLSTSLHNPPMYFREKNNRGVWRATFLDSKEIPAEYFNVFPDGTDVTANLQKAADFCRISENTNSTPGVLDLSYGRTLVLGNKTTGAYTLNGTLYLNCNFDFSQAQIKASPLGTNVAIWVGPTSTNQLAIWNLRGKFPAVLYSTNAAYAEGTAITVAAVESCIFEYGFIEKYRIGTKFLGNNAGNARNIHLNNFANACRYAWWLESFGPNGFCNLNQYLNFNALATVVPPGGTNVLTGYEQLVMTTDGSLNGNVFIGGGIEGFASARFMVITNGTGNTFRDFRLEQYPTIFTGQKPYWEVISTIGTSHGQDNHLYPATTIGMFAPPVRQTGNAAGNSSGGSRQFHFTQVDADKPAIYLEPTRYASVPLFTVYGMPTGTTGETNALSNPELYKLAMTPDVLGGKPASASSLRWYIENDVGTIRWRNTVSQQKMSINETQLAARVAGAADDHFTIGSQTARLSWLTNGTETVGVVTYGDGTLQIAGTHPTIGSNNLAGLTITGDDRGTAVRSLMTYSHLVGDYVQTAFGSFPSNYTENATVRDWAGGYVVNSANSQNRGMRFSANATNQFIDLIVGPYGPTQIPQLRVTHEGVAVSNLTINNYLNQPGMGLIDPRAYGADPTDSNDDTAAVQAALAAAGNTMGVFFAPGTWRLANVSLSGTKYLVGQGATIKSPTTGLTNSQSLFSILSSAKVRIANLTFDMSDVTNRYAYGIGALVATNIDLQVENCAFTNFPASAILFSQASGKYAVRRSQFLNGRAHSGVTGEFSLGVTVSNGGGESTLLVEDSDFINTASYSAGALPSGVLVSGGTNGCRAIVQRNYFYRVGTDSYGNLTAGVDLYQQAPNSIVQDNKFVACPFSIKTQEQSDVALLNNYLDGTGAVAGTTFGAVRGVYWTPAARNLYVPSPRGLRMVGNIFKNFTNSTAFLGSGDPTNATGGLFIIGNHFENIGRGIDMRYLSGVAHFQDNVITNASQYGITLSGQTAAATNLVVIEGGSVHATGLYSLNLLDTIGDIVVRNVYVRGQDGVYILSPGGSATVEGNNIVATAGHGIAIIATNNVDARIDKNLTTVIDTSYRAILARNLRSVAVRDNVVTPRIEASTTSGTAMITRLKNNRVTASDITTGAQLFVDVEAEQGTTTNLNQITANTMAVGSLDNTMTPRLVMFGATNWGSEIRYGNTTNSADSRWSLRYVPSTDTFDIVARDNSGGVYANMFSLARLTSTARIAANTTNTGEFTALGNLIVGDSTQLSRYIISDATNTSANGLRIKRNGIDRWVMRVDGTESGANAGGNLSFIRYDDGGTTLSTPLQITRSSGLITVGGDMTIGGGITLGGVYRTTWPSGGSGPTNGTAVWVEGVQQTTFNLQDGSEIAGAFIASNYIYSIVANSIATNKVDSTFRSFFKDRSTDTGTQTASTISDFADVQWANFTNSMVASNNISFAYDTANKKLMISSTGGGGGSATNAPTIAVDGVVSTNVNFADSAELLVTKTGINVTYALNTNGVVAGTYGGVTLTVNSKGLITSITSGTNTGWVTNQVDRPIFITMDAVTVASAVTNETSILGKFGANQTNIITANVLSSNKVIRIKASGTFTPPGSDWSGAYVRVKFGGRILTGQIAEMNSTQPSPGAWFLEASMHVRGSGSNATNVVVGYFANQESEPIANSGANIIALVPSGTLDTTINNTLDITFQNEATQPMAFTCNHAEAYYLGDDMITGGGVLTALDASWIVQGTLDAARLPSSVLLESEAALLYGGLNNNNTWTGTQTFTNDVDFFGDVSFNTLTVNALQSTTWTNLGNLTVGSNLVVAGTTSFNTLAVTNVNASSNVTALGVITTNLTVVSNATVGNGLVVTGAVTTASSVTAAGPMTSTYHAPTAPWQTTYQFTEMYNQNGVTALANTAYPWGTFALAGGTFQSADVVSTNHPGISRAASAAANLSGVGLAMRPTTMYMEPGMRMDFIFRPLLSDTNAQAEFGWLNNININAPTQGLTLVANNGFFTVRGYNGSTNATIHSVSNAFTANTWYRGSIEIGPDGARDAIVKVVESDTGTSIMNTTFPSANFPARTVAVGSDVRVFLWTSASATNICDIDYLGILLPTQRR